MEDKDLKKKIKLNTIERILLVLSIFQAIFSIFCAIVEGDIKWLLIALPWSLLAVDHYYNPRIKKIQNEIIETQQEAITVLLDSLQQKEQ